MEIDTYCGSCKSDPCLVESKQVCCHDAVRYGYCQRHGTYCGFCQHDPCLVETGVICCHDQRQRGFCQHDSWEDRELIEVPLTLEDGTPYVPEPRRERTPEEIEARRQERLKRMGNRPARPTREQLREAGLM